MVSTSSATKVYTTKASFNALTSVGFSHPSPPTVQITKIGPLIHGKLGHPSDRPGLTGRS